MNYKAIDEESALLGPESTRITSRTSNFSYAKIALAGIISIVLIAAITINHPSKIENLSNSISNLDTAYGNKINKRTNDNDSNIIFKYQIYLCTITLTNTYFRWQYCLFGSTQCRLWKFTYSWI